MHLYHVFGLLYTVFCVCTCWHIANTEGRSPLLAGVLGFFFGIFAVIGYLFAGDKPLPPAPYSDKKHHKHSKR